jgi:hypothetical protein
VAAQQAKGSEEEDGKDRIHGNRCGLRVPAERHGAGWPGIAPCWAVSALDTVWKFDELLSGHPSNSKVHLGHAALVALLHRKGILNFTNKRVLLSPKTANNFSRKVLQTKIKFGKTQEFSLVGNCLQNLLAVGSSNHLKTDCAVAWARKNSVVGNGRKTLWYQKVPELTYT